MSNPYIKTTPKKWTLEEVQRLLDLKKSGYSVADLARELDRGEISIQVKLKRLGKKNDTYNKKHRELKYQANENYLKHLQPKSVLDLYAGNSFYTDKVEAVTTNDVDPQFATNYNQDAFLLLMRLYAQKQKFDLVDLDPFGSAYECFDLAIRLAKKGLVVSFGEWGHLRWKRLDYVRDRYRIRSLDEFIPEKFIEEVQRQGRINKKELIALDSVQYGNFLRVYFEIKSIKITEQWEK